MALEKLDWNKDVEVADGYTDIRGWKLYDSSSSEVGRVDDLLFDRAAHEVRYLVSSIDGRRVLVPIGQVDIEESSRRIIARGYDRQRLIGLREYNEGAWNDTEERGVYGQFMPDTRDTDRLDYRGETFRGSQLPKTIQLMEEKLRLGKRREQIGEVEVGKRPVVEPVQEQVTLERDKLQVDRQSVNRPAASGETVIGDAETIRVPLYGEEVVANKETFVREEVTLSSTPETRTETVRDEVRREELTFAGTEPTDIDRGIGNEDISQRPIDRPKQDIDVVPEDRDRLI